MSAYPSQLKTPADIQIPMVGIQDHGLSLVHEFGGGKPRNYLHEISVSRDEKDTIRYLESSGYAYRYGYVRPEDKQAMWTYSKAFPLSVGAEVK